MKFRGCCEGVDTVENLGSAFSPAFIECMNIMKFRGCCEGVDTVENLGSAFTPSILVGSNMIQWMWGDL
jgi:glycine/serine hydroxymethyltransferase